MPTPNPSSTASGRPARRHVVSCLAAAALLLSLAGCASAITPAPPASPVALSVIDRDSGQPLAVHRKDGRSFVAGRPGARYSLRIANRTAGRVLVVLSVDGVNVISGETAAASQSGYVLEAWQGADIAGWRKSEREIAAFEFAALSDSYAARTGRPGNVGVIGMAVFLEKPHAPPPVAEPPSAAPAATSASESSSASDAAAPASAQPEARAARKTERLGTAHGQRESSASRRTGFERSSGEPQAVVEIGYDSYVNLVRAGVIAQPVAPRPPRAFPGDPARGFVPDPPAR